MEISETIAVLGADETTGFAMARNMARAGLSVRAWNQPEEKAAPLAEDGVCLADSPAETFARASVRKGAEQVNREAARRRYWHGTPVFLLSGA